VARAAWAVSLAAMSFDIISGWAMIFLRGMNEVLPSVRIGVLSAVVKFVVGAGLLLIGAGLMSLPLASLVGSLLQQSLARRHCHKRLGDYPPPEKLDVWENLRVLWPNSWRLGVTAVCSCLTAQASTAICLKFLGLTSYAQYGLSCQLVGIISGMAMVWTQVKWQVVGQHRTRHDYAAMQQALMRRYQRLKSSEARLPDILFIDGGKGQLAQAIAVLTELGISGVTLIGIAKGEGRKPGLETLHFADGADLQLPADSPGAHLTQHIRD